MRQTRRQAHCTLRAPLAPEQCQPQNSRPALPVKRVSLGGPPVESNKAPTGVLSPEPNVWYRLVRSAQVCTGSHHADEGRVVDEAGHVKAQSCGRLQKDTCQATEFACLLAPSIHFQPVK